MKVLVTVSALVLWSAAMSCDAPAVAEDSLESDTDVAQLDLSDLGLDIGRLGMINEKTQEVWLKLRSDENRGGYTDPVVSNSTLRRTVWQFNELREDLCSDRFMVDKSCGPPYVPKWAFESSKVIPSAAELQKRLEDLSDHVVPLWDAACDRLRKIITRIDSMYYCSIE